MITPQSAWRLTAPLRRGAYGGEKSLPFVGEVAEQSEDGEVVAAHKLNSEFRIPHSEFP